jgi:cation diffusion facilitator CzcD-associated flavoprotein CzcO
MRGHARKLDILVIGAGQAGLALGFHLKKTPFRFQLVERNARVGDSWRKRYASLVLFTPVPIARSQALRCPAILTDSPPKMRWPTIWRLMPATSICLWCWEPISGDSNAS